MAPFASTAYRSFGIALSALLSGVLLGCCFPPIDAAPLAWVALVPLGIVLTERRLTLEAWAGVYLGGLAYHMIGLSWLSNLYGSTEPLSHFTMARIMASQIGAAIFCLSILLSRRAIARFRLPVCLGLPLFWMGFEWLRATVNFAIDPATEPWLRLGGTQIEWLTIAQIAGIGGEGILSALVAFVNGWIFEITCAVVTWRSNSQLRWHRAMLVAPFGLVLSISYGSWCLSHYQSTDGPTVALMGRHDWLMQPDRDWKCVGVGTTDVSLPPDLLVWPELADHHKLLTGQPASKLEIPEDVRVLAAIVPTDYGAWCRNRLATAASKANAAVLVGCERVDISGDHIRRYNTVAYADPRRGFVGFSDKRHLAPVFERGAASVAWLGLPARRCYSQGSSPPMFTLSTSDGPRQFACVVCYDIAFPSHLATLGKNGAADFFVHCGSEGADPTGSMSKALLRMARLRAIETRRPIVRNCHGGASGVIDAAGRFTQCGKLDGDLACVVVPINPPAKQQVASRATSIGWATIALTAFCICLPWRMPQGRSRQFTNSFKGEAYEN